MQKGPQQTAGGASKRSSGPWPGIGASGQDLLRALYDSIHDAVMILEKDRFVDCNPRTLEIFGCERDDIIGSTPYALSPPLQPDGTPSERAAMLRIEAALRGESLLFGWRHRKPSGEELDAEVSLTPFSPRDGTTQLILAVVRDVTQRKEAEERLRATEAHEALVLRSLPLAFYMAYPEGDFGGIWVNEKVAQVSGFTTEDFRKNRGLWKSRLHPGDEERVMEEFGKLEPGDAIEVEYRWKHADGEYRWFLDRASLVPQHGSKTARIIGTWLEITQRKEMEDRLAKSQRELRSLTARLATVEEEERRRIAVLLHDSAAQDLALALLKLGALEDELPGSCSGGIEELSDLITATAEELRTLSHDLSPPELHEVGLGAALEMLASRCRRELGIDCVFRDDGRQKRLSREVRTTVFRCIEELMANVARHARSSSVILECKVDRDAVQVSVTDDGRGFDARDAGTRRAPNGGFGLFSVRERMKDIGGRLDLTSTPGEGTRVVLTVPLGEGDPEGDR